MCRAPGIAGPAALATIALATIALAPPSRAQEWSWPEKPQNLQVLPKDWPGSRLRAPMTGFTRALGVRCSHCHVDVLALSGIYSF